METDGCCGLITREGKDPVFFALSYHDFRVYTRSVKAGVEAVVEELDDFMGLDKCNLVRLSDSDFVFRVIEALEKFQSKQKEN